MYIPKNLIETNLETSGKEFIYKDTRQEYVGYYHKLSDGRFMTGRNPSNPSSREIIPNEILEPEDLTNLPYSRIAIEDSLPKYNEDLISEYMKVQNVDFDDVLYKHLPYTTYETPNEDDYEYGKFTRYFLIKTNEKSLMEVSEEIYDNISSQNDEWEWELYTPFKIEWVIKGSEDEVKKANLYLVGEMEKEFSPINLRKYLKYDYLKYHK